MSHWNRISTAIGLGVAMAGTVQMGIAQETEPVLEIHSIGLYEWPEVRKDKRVVETKRLLRSRIPQLALEFDMDPSQGEAMQLGWDLLTSKMSIRMLPTDQGMGASMVFEPGVGVPGEMFEHLGWLAEQSGFQMGEVTRDSMQMMGPMGDMELAFDDQRLWLRTTDAELQSLDIPMRDLPAGAVALASGRIDVNGLVELFAPGTLEEMEESSDVFAGSPIFMFVGPNASPVEFAMGTEGGRMHLTSRLIGAAQGMREMGASPESVFTAEDFRAVPVDAVRVSATQTNVGGLLKLVEQASASSMDDPFEEINRELGIDIIDDLVANVGDRLVFYMSDSTGGGGLFSSVVLLDLRDTEAMRESHARLVSRLNELAADRIRGYVRVMEWNSGGVDAWTMTTPGIPVPLELSWAIAEDTLVVAASPGSLRVALRQLTSRSARSVVDHRGFKEEVLPRIPESGAAVVYFADTRRLAKKGYGLTALLTSALANAARIPEDPERVRGALIDDFGSFTSGIKESSSVSWWDGDDLRTHYIGDESVLVELSAGLGAIADVQGVAVPALAAGVMLPALGQARRASQELMSSSQLRALAQGLAIYGMDHNDQLPASIDVLLEEGLILDQMLISPFGPAADGGPDYSVRLDTDLIYSFNARCMVAIDRAMLMSDAERIPVAFADSHVDMLTREQIRELLKLPINAGADEALDLPPF